MTTTTDREATFKSVSSYPWEQDSAFQSGYLSILEHSVQRSTTVATEDDVDLLLKAQCFFFARKYHHSESVDVAAYKSWIETRAMEGSVPKGAPLNQAQKLHASLCQQFFSQGISPSTPLPSEKDSALDLAGYSPPQARARHLESAIPETDQQSGSEPPYPTSFAAIVDLITRNEAIPGIEQIPETVLDVSLSPPDKTAWRQKPWEKAETTAHAHKVSGRSNGESVESPSKNDVPNDSTGPQADG